LFQSAPPPTPSRSGWLFHLDARNVTATHWEPLLEGTVATGFRVRLLETAGRAVKATLSSFRPVEATPVNAAWTARPAAIVPRMEEGRVILQLAAHQWTEIEASVVTPVVTLARADQLRTDRAYAQRTAESLLEFLTYLEEILGAGRIYIP
jgi:hypothetical protein